MMSTVICTIAALVADCGRNVFNVRSNSMSNGRERVELK